MTDLPATAPSPDDAFLLRMLETEHAACPVCGYDLHRLTVPRCTECGRPLTLRVMPVAYVRRAWVVATVVFSIEAGAGLLIVLVTLGSLRRSRGLSARREMMPPGLLWDVLYVAAIAMLAAPPALVLARRPFQRLPLVAQWLVCLAGTALVVLTFWGISRTLR